MHNDLSHPATQTTNASEAHPILARIARRALVMISLVLAVGLTGVVFARSGEQRDRGLRLVWIGRGAAAVVVNQSVSLEPAEPAVTESEFAPAPEAAAVADAEAQPASITIVPDTVRRTVLMEVTAYCPCTKCCGPQAQGITASGKHVSYNDGKFVAADTRLLPFGTRVIIPGYGEMQAVEVIDRGGAIKGNKLDVFFPSHEEALQWGRQKLEVVVEG